jgi:small-conductance mechanosensitive channel
MPSLDNFLPKPLPPSLFLWWLWCCAASSTAWSKLRYQEPDPGTSAQPGDQIQQYFFTLLFVTAVFIIWGVQTKDLFLTVSSVLTVIGVALFAQWSILSNITSGVILLFSFPFKIGDIIRIHDKDFPIEAEIEDIRSFHTLLKTSDGELITYPNTLLMQKSLLYATIPLTIRSLQTNRTRNL